MKVKLPMVGFAPFKILMGVIFLLSFLLLKETMSVLAAFISVAVGKAHSMGAWVAMWRAGKLNAKYIAWVLFFIALFTYVGVFVWSLTTLSVFTAIIFLIHFLFDEYILQEEKKTFENLISPIAIFIMFNIYVLEYLNVISFDFTVYLGLVALTFLLELIFVREITWQHINMKILMAFFIFAIYSNLGPMVFTLSILMWHYFFWFIYPVYKLHIYKREERNGFIFILLLLVATSMFIASDPTFQTDQIKEYYARYFNIITIVHVLSTAPFGFLFGLPYAKHHH